MWHDLVWSGFLVVCAWGLAYSLIGWARSVRDARELLADWRTDEAHHNLPYPMYLHRHLYPRHVVPSAADLDAVAAELAVQLATAPVPSSPGQEYLRRRNRERGITPLEMLSAVLGMLLGLALSVALGASSVRPCPSSTSAGASWQEYNTLLTGRAHDAVEIRDLQAQVTRFEAQFQSATVLYDSAGTQSPLAIPLWHGIVKISLAGVGPTYGPRWVLPLRVVPYAIGGNSPGNPAVFSYVDLRTQQVQGPFLAGAPPAQTSAGGGQ